MMCVDMGRCVAQQGICVARSEADCQQSTECETEDHCALDSDAQRCTDSQTRRSKAGIAIGIVLTSLGGVTVLGGAMGYLIANRDEGERNGGIAMGLGMAGLLGGIPLTIWGARKVDRPEGASQAGATLSVGPTGASFRLPF